MKLGNAELLDYAIEKFENKKYDEALEAFILSYNRGYEQEWIMNNIYDCYMAGNDETFRRTYAYYTSETKLSYEDCILDFIPYKDGVYYIFDKELGIFRGVFSIYELENTKQIDALQKLEYSAVAFEMDWNWNEEKNILVAAKDRKVYGICRDIRRANSFFKIPELKPYMKNVRVFSNRQEFQEYFHQNTSVYLPRAVYGKEGKKELLEIINQEHQYRLTPEGRNTDNVLLTIGIPTHNRGNLLLDRMKSLCQMPYDAEIEFAISKNGKYYYQDEYRSVEKIQDARINYVGYDEELTMSVNWQNVIKIAHGKFVLLVSDEDDVIVGALEHYLKLLSNHENLGMVRSRTVVQYGTLDQSQIFKRGKEAFLEGFLGQNYLSGGIYNRKLFLEAGIEYWNEKYQYNSFYRLYPHQWWQAILAFKGDYATEAVYLVREGECVLFDEKKKYREDQVEEDELIDSGMDETLSLVSVSTYESRMEQFRGAVQLIDDFQELDGELKSKALLQLLNKTYFLMKMVFEGWNYKVEEFPDWVNKLLEKAIDAAMELQITQEQRKMVLESLLKVVKILTDN